MVDHVDEFDSDKLNLYLNTGCYTSSKVDSQLNNAPASCNPPCFRITTAGEYCYMGTRNNNFSNRRHIGQITVTENNGNQGNDNKGNDNKGNANKGNANKGKRDRIVQGAKAPEKRKFFRIPNFSKEV